MLKLWGMGAWMEKLSQYCRKCRLEEFDQGWTSSSKSGARPKSAKQKLEFGEISPTKGIKIEVKGWELIARANPKNKVSVMHESLVRNLGLPVLNLNTLLGTIDLKDIKILYLGYTEMKLNILEIGQYDQDILMMDCSYESSSPEWSVELGSQHLI